MAKRFIDTQIWTQNKWFRKLEPRHKLLWIYLITNCDQVGVWEEDMELASFLIGFEFTVSELVKVFGERLYKFNGKKYWIVDFIPFQYGVLQEGGKNRPHQSYIDLLKSHSLYIEYRKSIERDKEKDKDKDKEKDFILVNKSSSNEESSKELQEDQKTEEPELFDFSCIKKRQYLESVYRATVLIPEIKVDINRFEKLAEQFIAEQQLKDEPPRNVQDYKNHFISWMKIQVVKPENQPKTKMVY